MVDYEHLTVSKLDLQIGISSGKRLTIFSKDLGFRKLSTYCKTETVKFTSRWTMPHYTSYLRVIYKPVNMSIFGSFNLCQVIVIQANMEKYPRD